MKLRNKKENKKIQKLRKLSSIQDHMIEILGHYYSRTDEENRDVEKEMFPLLEPLPCDCCGDDVYPIHLFLNAYHYIRENIKTLDVDEIDLGLVKKNPNDSEPSDELLN